jgi:thiamine-phosphate pyrophosphorylase
MTRDTEAAAAAATAADRGAERIRGVYLLTPDWDDTARLLEVTEAALGAGVAAVQYRHKRAAPPLRRTQAQALRALTARHGALLIVNDDPALAAQIGADGVHVGREDAAPAQAVRAAPPGRAGRWLVGVSCYNDWARALEATAAAAGYVAFGAMFASATKPAAVSAPLSLLGRARRAGMHVVAIGGIDAGNIGAVAAAGAHAAALISAVYGAGGAGGGQVPGAARAAAAAAARLLEEFERGRQRHESQRTAV